LRVGKKIKSRTVCQSTGGKARLRVGKKIRSRTVCQSTGGKARLRVGKNFEHNSNKATSTKFSDSKINSQFTGGKARLTEGSSFRKKSSNFSNSSTHRFKEEDQEQNISVSSFKSSQSFLLRKKPSRFTFHFQNFTIFAFDLNY